MTGLIGKKRWGIPTYLYFLLPLALPALFINKAFHIDDALFLGMAERLPWTLLGDAGGRLAFLGVVYEDLSAYESTHPILVPFLLKIGGLLQWGDEPVFWTYHLLFLVFPLLILYFARIYAQTRSISMHWVWYLAISPLFLVNATNLMTDIAMITFWMGAIFMSVVYCERKRPQDAVVASVSLFLALLTAYQSVCLFPLLLCFFMVRGDFGRGQLLILAAPFLAFAAYLLAVYGISGYFPFLTSAIDLNIGSEVSSGMGLPQYLHKTTGTLINLGLGLAVVTPLLLLSVNRRRLLQDVIFASILSFALFHLGKEKGVFEGYSTFALVVMRVLMLIGAIWAFQVLAKIVDGFRLLLRCRKRAGHLFLPSLWFMGVLAYNVLFLPYATARYVLPAIPPALLLLFGHGHYRVRKGFETLLMVFGCLGALFMTTVDYFQARADYVVYQEVRGQLEPGATLWYSDDAGLQRYFDRIGGQYLTRDRDHINVGDKVLITRGLINEELGGSLSLVKAIKVPSFLGFTLFDTRGKAGFYRSYDGLLPMARAPYAKQAYLMEVNFFDQNRNKVEIIQLSNPNYHGQRTFTLEGGETKGVMFMHPDAKVGYPFQTDKTVTLKGEVITDPGSWSKEGDGVSVAVGVRTAEGEQTLWEAYLDARNVEADRSPRHMEVAIPPTANLIWFSVGPGPKGDYRHDGVGWFDLTFEGNNGHDP